MGDWCGDNDAATLVTGDPDGAVVTGDPDGAGVGLPVVGWRDGDSVGPAVLGAGVGPLVPGGDVGAGVGSDVVGAGVGSDVVGLPVVGLPVVGLIVVGDGDGSAVYTGGSPVVCDIIELVVMISAMSFWRSTQISSVSPLSQPLSAQTLSTIDAASARATSGKVLWACACVHDGRRNVTVVYMPVRTRQRGHSRIVRDGAAARMEFKGTWALLYRYISISKTC